MLKHFTKRVERIVKLANVIAREYDLDYVGTEHILLALEREGSGMAHDILHARDITAAKLKEQVDRLTKKSMEDTWVFGRLPGSPHFRNVVATALEIAEQLDAREMCSEHLLLALLKEDGSVAYQALEELSCSYDEIHAEVVRRKAERPAADA